MGAETMIYSSPAHASLALHPHPASLASSQRSTKHTPTVVSQKQQHRDTATLLGAAAVQQLAAKMVAASSVAQHQKQQLQVRTTKIASPTASPRVSPRLTILSHLHSGNSSHDVSPLLSSRCSSPPIITRESRSNSELRQVAADQPLPPLQPGTRIRYSNDELSSDDVDFTITLPGELEVAFHAHKCLLRPASEYFDGLLEDEPDRESMQLPDDWNVSSGDVALFFDLVYGRARVSQQSSERVMRIAKLAHLFYAAPIMHQCELALTSSMSPRTAVRSLTAVKAAPRGGSQAAASSSRATTHAGFDSAAIAHSDSLTNLQLADRLHMNELKSACIDELTTTGFTQVAKDMDSDELHDALQALSKSTLCDMLEKVIAEKY